MKRGFTLIELLISLALMVMLMLGVNYIFTAVGTATGSAQMTSKIGRDIQAAQGVLARDMAGLDAAAPCLLINSQVQPAFSYLKDKLGNSDQANPLIDPDGNPLSIANYNYRSHRTDVMAFFARGQFNRMTGNEDEEFISDVASSEAWVWYGHLRLANNDASTYPRMGEEPQSSNNNNYFASQWILGRVAMLLIEPDITTTPASIRNSRNRIQHYIDHGTGVNLTPLSQGANGEVAGGPRIDLARYDLAGTSIDGFRELLNNFIATNPNEDWYSRMMLNDADSTVAAVANSQRRFKATPFVVKPIDSEAASKQVPIFMPACSQFMVEFAGDFFRQDPTTGAVTAMESDGEIDYVITPNVPDPAASVRRIRWYGMPRDTGSPINPSAGTNGGPDGIIKGDGPSQNMVDVVPLSDVMLNASPTIPIPSSPLKFVERKVPTHQANYSATSDTAAQFQYIAAWGPDVTTPRPSMIRLVISIEDPMGRMTNPMTSELVFKLR